MSGDTPYNPLDLKEIGANVTEGLLRRDARALKDVEPFHGAGIYAIYYVGPFRPYAPLVEWNRRDEFSVPIYIGKAVHQGKRKGLAVADDSKSKALYRRLREHAESVNEARSLAIADFWCRYLVVDHLWVELAESALIARFNPIWNTLVDGFGNHDPGKGRYQGMRPRWDVLHPGRDWAAKCADRNETEKQIAAEVECHLRTSPPPPRRRQRLL